MTEEHKAKIKAKLQNHIWTEDHKAKRLEHLNRLHSNPEYKAKLLEGLKIRNASKEHQEHLKRIQLSKSHSVIVFDTLNNETTVLPSIQEAARSIGSSFNNVRVAIKGIKETGDFSRLIKKRYKVKPYEDKS